ncbi:MAG: hypothetical protein ACM65L_17400 [Microcoleus sp.]
MLIPDGKTLKFQPITQPDNPKIYGPIYALQIHDTYTADLTFYYQNATIKVKLKGNKIDKLSCLN